MIEAGLGGRYDATNVIPSRVQVLTSVGLEHTRWLGPTITDIAGEKLDVVQPGATLVLGHGLHPGRRARRRGGGRRARRPDRPCRRRSRRDRSAALGTFQRRNFALARAAAEAYLGELDPAAVAARRRRGPRSRDACRSIDDRAADAASTGRTTPTGCGRSPSPCRRSWPATAASSRVVSILDDKDAAGMLAGAAAGVR